MIKRDLVIKNKSMTLDSRSIALRRKIIDVMAVSRCGHIRSAFSCLEIVRVLYDHILKPDDKFILSKGHGCLAQYIMLAEKGIISQGDLFKFCQDGALLGGHPTDKIPGIEVATGSLGHGLPMGVGFALAGYRTFVLMGDGECDEGSVWEAALCASKHKLSNLTVIIDYNEQQSYGTTHEVCELEPLLGKWNAFGFLTAELDGHDMENRLMKVFPLLPFGDKGNKKESPNAIICHTIKGKGIKFVEDNMRWHYRNDITDEEVKALYEGLENYDKE